MPAQIFGHERIYGYDEFSAVNLLLSIIFLQIAKNADTSHIKEVAIETLTLQL